MTTLNAQHCSNITSAENTNLHLVSRYLNRDKIRFFNAAYASFRILDDLVEDLMPEQHHARPVLENWMKLCKLARENKEIITDNDRWAQHIAIFDELKWGFTQFEIDFAYWDKMYESMKMDVEDQAMNNWLDFDRYCLGGSVAPTAIFLTILLSKKHGEKYTVEEDLQIEDLAIPIRTVCYLVHIIRDLLDDALTGPALITLPESVLASVQLTKDEMSTIARQHSQQPPLSDNDKQKLTHLVVEILNYAKNFKQQAQQNIHLINSKIVYPETKALNSLIEVYYHMYDTALKNPSSIFNEDGLLSDQNRKKILGVNHHENNLSNDELFEEVFKIANNGVHLMIDIMRVLPPIAQSVVKNAKDIIK